MTDLRTAAQQALEVIHDTAYGAAIFREEVRDVLMALRDALAEPVQEPAEYEVAPNGRRSAVLTAMMNARTQSEAALAEPQTADDLREPKNGAKWRVEWWNESCRMMLPEDRKLDSFVAYKNGTLKFTIKRTPT